MTYATDTYSNPCRRRKFFTPPQPSPNPLGSKKFTNDLGLLYSMVRLRSKPLISCCAFKLYVEGGLWGPPHKSKNLFYRAI